MALKDALNERLTTVKKKSRCPLGALRDGFDPETQESFDVCVLAIEADRDTPQHRRVFTVAWLTSTLNENGYSIGKTTVSDHLKGTCICDKSAG